MGSARDSRLTSVSTFISAAFPRHAAKQLVRALPVSPSQAARIAKTGHVPRHLRAVVLALLERTIAANKARLEHIQVELGTISHAEVVVAGRTRGTADMGSDAGADARPAQRPTAALVKR